MLPLYFEAQSSSAFFRDALCRWVRPPRSLDPSGIACAVKPNKIAKRKKGMSNVRDPKSGPASFEFTHVAVLESADYSRVAANPEVGKWPAFTRPGRTDLERAPAVDEGRSEAFPPPFSPTSGSGRIIRERANRTVKVP
jgi:hypothetical protein